MLSKLLQHPLNGFRVLLAFAFNVYEYVINLHYHKIVKLLCQDLVNIALEYGQYVAQSKSHDLILEVAIADPEGRLPFIIFPNSHLMVGISQIELGETLSPT